MIYKTGDFHGGKESKKLNTKNFPEQKEMTKDDYLIILGDFGCLDKTNKQENHYLKWLNTRNYTTLFVDGNHEDFSILNGYPVVEKFGGKVHQIADSIFHLMRGEVYTIDNKKIFVMGGAETRIHKLITKEEFIKNKKRYTIISDNYEVAEVIGQDWFPEEQPSEEEYLNAIINLQKHDKKVDYILSHCASNKMEQQLTRKSLKTQNVDNHICDFFDKIEDTVEFSKWYFGHYHEDKKLDDKHECMYNTVSPL